MAAATLALIVASPFAGVEAPSLSLPTSTSAPVVSRPGKAAKVDAVATSSPTKISPKKVVKAKVKIDRSGYNLDTTATVDTTVTVDKVAAEKAALAEKIAADKAAAAEKDADSKAGTFIETSERG